MNVWDDVEAIRSMPEVVVIQEELDRRHGADSFLVLIDPDGLLVVVFKAHGRKSWPLLRLDLTPKDSLNRLWAWAAEQGAKSRQTRRRKS